MRDTRDSAQLRTHSQTETQNAYQRVWVLLLVLCAILFALPQPIFAHPADQAYVVATFDADADEDAVALRIHVQMQLGPLLGVPLWAEADRDQNGTLDETEIAAWLPKFTERNFAVQVDGVRVPLQAQIDHLGNFLAFRSVAAQPQLKLTLRAPVSRGSHSITFAHQLNKQGGGFRADVASNVHAAFSPVVVNGNNARATLDTPSLQPITFWQRLLMLFGLGGLLAAVVSGVTPNPSSSPAIRISGEGSLISLPRSDRRGLRTRITSSLLALITLLATSNPTALPSFGVAAVGGCQIEPSAIWLKSNIEGGTPQQTVQVVFPVNDIVATMAANTGSDTGSTNSIAITNTAGFNASVNGTYARIAQARVLTKGRLSLLVAVPPTTGAPVPRTISVRTPYGNCTQTVSVAQATQWNIYISQFGHPDAGWCTGNTYAQERQRQVNNQITALDQISATLSRPFDNRQRFEADNFWQFDEALKDNPTRAAQFQDYVQQGYYGLNPIYAPLLVQALDSESFLQGMLPYANRERIWNLPKRTSVSLSEIPESTVGMPTLLRHAGITSIARGVLYGNIWGGAMPTEIETRRVFWWQGSDGSKVLARMQAEGAYFELLANTYDDFANTLSSKAAAYENAKTAGNYPADAFLLFGTLFDCGNVDTSYKIGDFIQQWNNSVAFPHIVGGNQNEFFDYVAQNFGSQLQTYSGGFDTQWTDGLAYHATSTVQFRNNAIGLLTAQKLSVIANAPGASGYSPTSTVWLDAIKDHLLYAEHSTLANNNACFSCPLQQNLEQHRAALVRDVFTRTQSLIGGALNALMPNISTGAATSTEANPFVLVFNPLSWERSAAITVTVNSTTPLYLTDLSTGNTIPSQLVAPNTLMFVAPNVPSLGYKVFRLNGPQDSGVAVPFTTDGSGVIASSRFSVTVDGATGGVSIYDKFLSRDLVGGSSGHKANQLVYNYSGTLQSNTNIATHVDLGPVAATIKITGKPSVGNITGFTQTVKLLDGIPVVLFENALNKTVSNPNCTSNCDLERIYFAYPINTSNASTPQMRVESNGGITNIGTDILPGAVRDTYGVQSFANVADGNASVTVAMPDTTLVEFVGTSGPRTHEKNTAQPASSEMLALAYLSDVDGARQNALAGDLAFRFALAAQGNAFDPLQSVRFGWEQRTPVIVSRLPANQPGELPGVSRSFGQINTGHVVLSALKPAEDGNGFVARFWNPNTTPQQVNFDLSLLGATQGQYVDGLERPLTTGGETFVFSGAGSLSMTAQSFATLRLMRGSAPAATTTPAPPTQTATPATATTTPMPSPTPEIVAQASPTSAPATSTALPTATPLPSATPQPTAAPQQTLAVQQTATLAPTPTQTPTRDLRVLYLPQVFRYGLLPNATRSAEETRAAAPTATAATPTPSVTPAVPRTATATAAAPATAAATATAIPTQPPPPTRPGATPTATPRVLTLLDDFNRTDGTVGGKWLGFPGRYALLGNQLAQSATPSTDRFSMMYFDKVLGATQEVGIQIGTLGEPEQTSEIGLMLKWQGGPGSPTSAKCYAVEVQYEPKDKRASISFCDEESSSWESIGPSFPLSLVAGDFFSARVDGAGKVQVFKNSVLIGTGSVAEWVYVTEPGRPGVWIYDVPGTTLDNFSAE